MLLSVWSFAPQSFAEEPSFDAAADDTSGTESAAKTWAVSLNNAPIRTFISQVSDITGYSFVVDPRVKGNVTVVSKAPMNASEVYELFQTVLSVYGYTAVPGNGVIKLVPNTGAKQDSIRLCKDVNSSELVTCVIPIKNTSAIELVPILRPLIPQYGHLAGVASANSLIITDHSINVKRIMEIISKLDGAGSEELEVIQLKSAGVNDMVEMLTNLEPVDTGNNAKAGGSGGRVTIVAEDRTNRLILKGEKSARARIRILVEELDKPSEFSGATKVLYLRYAEAAKVAELLKSLSGEQSARTTRGKPNSSKSGPANQDVNIQADETLNALIIRAEPSDMADLLEIVKQLDIRRAQVLIEAAIVEVSGDMSSALGVQWASIDQNKAVGGINFTNVGNNLNGIIGAIEGTGPAALASGISLAGGERDSSGTQGYGALLQALASNSNANLLSTPSLMTLDNEEAVIVVGQNVPFITGSTTTDDTGGNPFQTISREDVGLTLRVLPQINDGDVIRLMVQQEVSSVVPTSAAIASSDLITNKRSIETNILADNGETIVLGGLISDESSNSVQKVPVLGDIPGLGTLFRSRNKTAKKSNLIVFLKPSIIRDSKQAQATTKTQYEKIRSLQLDLDGNGNVFKSLGQPSEKKRNRLPEDMSDLYNGR
jgi:general secretion pathway protein D